MDGILVQTTRSIRALIGIATEGAPAEEVEVAYRALRDQCAAAEREALRTPSDPEARFDARAAAVLAVAYRPVLDVLCSGRGLHPEDAELAQKSSGWLQPRLRGADRGRPGQRRAMPADGIRLRGRDEGARDPSSPA